MSDRHVLVLGAGGHAKVVISTLQASGRVVDAILDDEVSLLDHEINGVPVVGKVERAHEFRQLEAIIAIGENQRRRELAESLSLDWTIAVHPSAVVHPMVEISPGSVVLAGAVLQPGATVGPHAIVNTGSTVDHDCSIGSFAHLAPGSHLGGGVRIGDGAFVGIGACVLPNCEVGEWAVLGAGAIAIRSLARLTVAVGVPAKPVREKACSLGWDPLQERHLVERSSEEIQWAFIGPDDPRWRNILDRSQHDFYHLPEYAALMGKMEQRQAFAFYAMDSGRECLIPLLRRQLPDQYESQSAWCDLQSPYGYPAPLFTHPEDLESVERFLKALVLASNELGACSIFLRLHPLFGFGPGLRTDCFRLRPHGETVSVNLSQSEEEMWSQTRSGHKYEIRRLEKMGFTTAIDEWTFLDAFIRMYFETMERVDADQYYKFDSRYFTDLKAALGDHLHLCCVLSPEGQPVAAGLFTCAGNIMQYHLSGSDPIFHRLAPTKLMLHTMRLWGKQHGCAILHLGGGLGADHDALFQFKAGFSKDLHRFQTCRIIVNQQRYSVLKLRAGLSPSCAADLDAVYFPPYY